jgi:phage-related protein (TIGR01555 family)
MADDSRQGTFDNFVNMAAQLGYGSNNLSSASSYGFNPLSRSHQRLEWMYRGSWIVKKVVDCPADDMTREGISIESDMAPDQMDALTQHWNDLQIWQRINETIKWARLYGGCLGVLMIDGQKLDTPLRIDTVTQGQFKGILVLDRWMVWPHMEDPVTDYGADFGLPKYYDVVADARSLPNMRIHHSRCIRLDGVQLPYWQKVSENLWGLSVIEPLFDRLIAFDSATQGAAQLIYKAHLRVMKIADYRENIASMGKAHQAVLAQLNMIRLMQSNEGLTVLDKEDEFEATSYSFSGLSEMMDQFSMQISGAADIPITRLFGQSPAGMNATGESDLRNYYDGIKSQQESRLRRYINMLLHLSHRSLFGLPLPKGFNFSFSPLWQLNPIEKSQIAQTLANATSTLFQDGILSQKTAMKEIRQSSRITGFGSNITDEDINALPDGPPAPPMGEMLGAEQGQPQSVSQSEAAANTHTDLPSQGQGPGGPSIAEAGLGDPVTDQPGVPPIATLGQPSAVQPPKPLTPEQQFEQQHEQRSEQSEQFEQQLEQFEKQMENPLI